MDKQELLQLEKLATLKPSEIQQQQPALHTKLSEQASLALKNKIERQLKTAPKEIRDGFAKIDFSVAKLGKLDVKDVLTTNLLTGNLTPDRKKELEDVAKKVPELGKIDNILLPNLPVFLNPLFEKDLQKAKVYRLTDIAGIAANKQEELIKNDLNLTNVEPERLELLVKNNVLTTSEASKIGITSNLHTLLDGSFELVDIVNKNAGLTDLSDLIKVDRAGWKKWIDDSKVQLPAGVTSENYADFVFKKVENLYPEQALTYRTTQVKSAELAKSITAVEPLLKNNAAVFGNQSFESLDKSNVAANQIKAVSQEYDKIDRIAKVNPGLQLEKLLNDKTLNATDKTKAIAERVGLIEKFAKQNAEVNFLSLEYKHDSNDLKLLNFQGFSDAEKSMVLKNVKAKQRVYSFTQDIEDTETVMAAGYHSSFHVASGTLNDFVKTTKLSEPLATKYFENAHMAIIRSTSMIGAILDINTGSFDWTAVGNVSPTIQDYLKDIPGYQDLFGSMAYCDCEHCQSIYSPAAYFVDLMQFIEQYIIKKYFTGTQASHVLNLKTRRPDLWTLELNCENTSTLVPYLDIINEILESYIAAKKGFAGNLNDRAAVETFIYKNQIALEITGAWKNQVKSFQQPFHLPMTSVATYLGHFEKTREDIAWLLDLPQTDISKIRLHLSDKEFQLIITPDATSAFIHQVYGLTFTLTAAKITPFNAQDLLKPMGVDRKQLEAILKTTFVTNNGADNILIQSEKTNNNSIQNDIERIKNLTYEALDRAHRFVRLWRKTNLSINELDLLLNMLRTMAIAADINAAAITALGAILKLKDIFKLNTEEVVGVLHNIPRKALQENDKSLFDRLFNHDDVVTSDGAYPKDTIKLIHPALAINKTAANAEFSTARISAALNRSDDEVLELIKSLSQPLGIVAINAANEVDRGFLLTHNNLSLLYRHSILADRLRLSIQDLFRLIKLVPAIANRYVENMAHIYALYKIYSWWKTTSFSLDDLHFILKTGAVVDTSNYASATTIATEVLEKINVGKQLTFADTVFAYDGITEAQSRQIISSNASIIELAPDGENYWLKTAFNPATAINIPAGITVSEIDLRKRLTNYHPQYLIPFHLSGTLKMSEETILRLVQALGINLDANNFTLELQGTATPAVDFPLLIDKLLPFSVLFKGKSFVADSINYILTNLGVFGINNLNALTLENIRRITDYGALVSINEDGSNNITDLTNVLGAYTNVTQYQTADQNQLSKIVGAKPEVLATIHASVSGVTNSVVALKYYQEIAAVCQYIGVGGNVLRKIVTDNYDVLEEATQDILGAFRSKYKTETERQEKLEKYQDSLRGQKRSALTTYLIHNGFPQFENHNDLYHYFLIDTELEGCARTSRLVAATMSLQLYIHRVLLNLEQDDKETGAAGKLQVRPDAIPADEWEWRKNYRVWEANRKVFLYPENYIEPELRDDKTPLFTELENELLQQEINADTVLDAYAKYMRGFDEVAHLKIAGSYHEKDTNTETDALHLFGVTADEPPVYYYRRVNNLYYSEKRDDRGVEWEPWQKISVQIPVRKVSPIIYNGKLHVFWVKITTLANTVFDSNRSVFIGYSHKVSIEFTTLKLDSSWTPPQRLNLNESYPFVGKGVIQDPLAEEQEKADFMSELHNILRSFPFFNFADLNDEVLALKTPRYALTPHYEPIDEYTLEGFLWNQVYPYVDSTGRLILTGAGYQMRAAVDFYNLTTQEAGIPISNVTGFTDPVKESVTFVKNRAGKIIERSGDLLFRAVSPNGQVFDNYAYGSLIVNTTKTDGLLRRHWAESTLNGSFDGIRQNQIAVLRSNSTVQIVNGAFSDAIIDVGGDILFLQGTPIDGNDFVLKRLGTTLSETLTRTLFTSGVDTTLNITTQKALKELAAPISLTGAVENKIVSDKIDFKGAYGNYYREIFFHIPFLLANHLNSQGKYKEAQKWYHYIFNPSATEVITFPAGATAAQKKKMELDRNWQYIEFRDIDAQKLREQLNDKQAIEVYKKDPFNPHAIARLRMSAYQKSIVMKYIDNLLDWGDQLFTQDTMESINEATLLYIIAKEILGERPPQIGDCGEGKITPKNYEKIEPMLAASSEFFAELENYTIVRTPSKKPITKKSPVKETATIVSSSNKTLNKYDNTKAFAMKPMTYGVSVKEFDELKGLRETMMPKITIKPVDDVVTGAFSNGITRLDWKKDSIYVTNKYKLSSFGSSIMRHVSPVFCVPGNKDLLDYYNRVDDRLYKIRNCMNIQGQKRQLALFAPEIDPRLLVRARAAGLSLDDILNSISGNLPPYRFTYILERAKAFTAIVQNFGSSLLSAIEKKNGEELSLLRITQQQNILELTTKSKELEIKSAEEAIKALNDRMESLDYQIGYYEGLVNERLNANERFQQIFKHSVSALQVGAGLTDTIAGIIYLVPQLGSPFAMKYGGQELGNSANAWAMVMKDLALVAEAVSASAGLEGGFDRRSEGWTHQKKVLQFEKKQTEKNLIAAEIRKDILLESLKLHTTSIEHNQEIIDFYGEKFSNLGLYTWLSATMQRLYKEAFNNALAIARLAEQAYRYERDDNTIFIDGSYFDSSKGGLLAGERLLMSLQTMERRYLETNYRKNEIDQAFSLTQINPAALLTLKQTGTCDFSIPEIFFDMFYPGQYRRKIQSVRLTIPSITGPYTNVGATLSLMASKIRMDAKLGAAELKDVPKSRTTTIATSTAQNDSGVFQLNFRDDRYMPFEGAGAISSWKLSLPKTFKQFDYQTINDVIIHVSYTAEYDELFRDKIEEQNDAIEGNLTNVFKNNSLSRTLSLRQEFSTDFHRLTEQPINTPILLKIQNKHFPMFMNGKPLKVMKAKLILVTPPTQTVNNVSLSVNGVAQSGFAKDPSMGNLFSKDLGNLFNGGIIKDHTVVVVNGGDLSSAAAPIGFTSALDNTKILDIALYIEYRLG